LCRAAVDEQLSPIDEATVFRREKNDRPRDLVRGADAAKRRRGGDLRREGLELLV